MGECGVPYERRFPMPRPALDQPWYIRIDRVVDCAIAQLYLVPTPIDAHLVHVSLY